MKFDLKTILLLGGLAIGGYLLYTNFIKKEDTVKVFPPPDATTSIPPVDNQIQNERQVPNMENTVYTGQSGDTVANYTRGWY